MAEERRGRGRLSNIKLLPRECAPIVAWASTELHRNDRTQTDIYQEFVAKLEALQKEHRGELDLTIPSLKAFNRHSIGLAEMAARMNETREIVSSLAAVYDPEDSDELTIIASEAIKTLVLEILRSKGRAGLDPKEAKALADAVRSAAQAQGISTIRRQKLEKDLKDKATEAVQAVVKTKGVSEEAAQEILDRFLGVSK